MRLFQWFHKSEKERLVAALDKRKNRVLGDALEVVKTSGQIKSMSQLERTILGHTEHLDPKAIAKIQQVIESAKTEEALLDQLAQIEQQLITLLKKGDSPELRKQLTQYVAIMQEMKRRMEQLELKKQTQLALIKEEQESVAAQGGLEAEKKKQALTVLKAALDVESAENRITRKKFFGSITKLGTSSFELLAALMGTAASAGKAVASGVSYGEKKLSEKLK